ncbi:MAG: HIT family protein [Gammaproteobacteria bacterium]|nr:HIT family protein [Gammaproteobacteria bacterium]MBU1625042.1 HIT family protein [Gammaproteobacteria bacterium]MBU1981302.1 HIT family protein [Gammaproteobacteria bacterium]
MSSEAAQEKKRDPNNPCLFCTDPRGVSIQHELAFSARDTYPTSPGHTLVIPRRHVASFFELTPEEVAACMDLIQKEKELLDEAFHPDGYNIGVNVGPAAGQSILHVHIHIIPRYKGDVENPQGGVRHVIPKKAHYTR